MSSPAKIHTSTPRAHALAYARNGFRVFPVCPETKKPLIKQNLVLATDNEKQINEWWSQFPSAMVGVATGAFSSATHNLVIIDIDKKPGGFETFAALEKKLGEFEIGFRVSTPSGGKHYYVLVPKGIRIKNVAGSLGPGVDQRGCQLDGSPAGYANGAGSVTADRRSYSFAPEVPVGFMEAPVIATEPWLFALMFTSSDLKRYAGLGITGPESFNGADPREWQGIAAEKHKAAQRVRGVALGLPLGPLNFEARSNVERCVKIFVEKDIAKISSAPNGLQQDTMSSAAWNIHGLLLGLVDLDIDVKDLTAEAYRQYCSAVTGMVNHRPSKPWLLEHAESMWQRKAEEAEPRDLTEYAAGRSASEDFADVHFETPDTCAPWPVAQPLTAITDAEPYPIEALPPALKAAVEEVSGYVQAPVALAAASALAVLSAAAQQHINVKRAEGLEGPVSLFFLTIAASGERKSTCDGYFTKPLRDYQAEQAELMRGPVDRYRAELATWEASCAGVEASIKRVASQGKSTAEQESRLVELHQRRPREPRIPHLLIGDETQENLAWRLAKKWPSAAMISPEAGSVFGAHGMSKDSAMKYLSFQDVLWDGGSHSVGRRTSESFEVSGARLTVGLQTQEAVLSEFIEQGGKLARGIGYFARVLIAHPQSTQGQRFFNEPPKSWPHLAEYQRRIAGILSIPAPLGDGGALSPAVMCLAPEAKREWVAYYDYVESQLAANGEFSDVRDVASKSADNVARLAALLQVFEHGMDGPVGLDAMRRGIELGTWYLRESQRFFRRHAIPIEMADAARLDKWLRDRCSALGVNSVAKNHVRQSGPLRDKARLDAAIKELTDLGRARVRKEGALSIIEVNPEVI